MQEKTTNSTVNYNPEKISEETTVCFTKVTNAKGVTIHGKVMKNDAEVGSVSYDEKGDFFITSLKPVSALTGEEVETLYQKIPGFKKEMLS
ncbi:MAG: hypothetical protein IJZ60_00660 [Bacteroides sp.]|nr:hypothetical protein [Bacteroides sp.]